MPAPKLWVVCPDCHQASGVPLEMNRLYDADYFECVECGLVWKQPKQTPARAQPRSPKKRQPEM